MRVRYAMGVADDIARLDPGRAEGVGEPGGPERDAGPGDVPPSPVGRPLSLKHRAIG